MICLLAPTYSFQSVFPLTAYSREYWITGVLEYWKKEKKWHSFNTPLLHHFISPLGIEKNTLFFSGVDERIQQQELPKRDILMILNIYRLAQPLLSHPGIFKPLGQERDTWRSRGVEGKRRVSKGKGPQRFNYRYFTTKGGDGWKPMELAFHPRAALSTPISLTTVALHFL